ncbi:hypothetical protein B0J13DRAFT_588663 [Dactylonectria estremocensis]|uniref:O-methyltransferase C-terminal domain-containing protein n=1 Tax=Dactylonectria estremocensis TaxID=1079267 RepID=A0A9P9DYW3_9HYPO|nr:hypothetical protein B0J13DRAFT_588663 [Dactylonectria estremocensis]
MAPSDLVDRIKAVAVAVENNEIGARETLLDPNRGLLVELETPTEFLQRLYFATVSSLSGILEIAANRKIFQHLQEATDGLGTEANGWHATDVSNAPATERYQHNILFCHRAASRSFGHFPEHFEKAGYKASGLTDGPYQSCFDSNLPFFEWLVVNAPYVDWFASIMSVYRVAPDQGFDSALSDVFVVAVSGGRGCDPASFAAGYSNPPSRLILQDQPGVIAQPKRTTSLRPSSTTSTRPNLSREHVPTPYTQSFLHGWSDDNGVKILQSLKLALKPGYSRVLLNEIVLSEEQPSVPATTMNMMMLGHLGASHERTEDEWRAIATDAGLEINNIHINPGSL